jgi:hypothetical protein
VGTGPLLGVMVLGFGIKHSPPSSTEVKERVELYLYSPLCLRDLFESELYYKLKQVKELLKLISSPIIFYVAYKNISIF